jgi:hypothetical protein
MVYTNDNYYGRLCQRRWCAPRGVDHDIMEISKEDEHEIPNIEAFIPTPSNDKEVRDVPLLETFVNTMEEATNISSLTPKSASYKFLGVSSKIAF